MKRIAIISLLAVFLTSHYAYATFPIATLTEQIQKVQTQDLTREDVEELYNEVISSIHADDFVNQGIEIQGLESCLQSLVYYILIMSIMGNIFGQITYLIQILLFLDVLGACLF